MILKFISGCEIFFIAAEGRSLFCDELKKTEVEVQFQFLRDVEKSYDTKIHFGGRNLFFIAAGGQSLYWDSG